MTSINFVDSDWLRVEGSVLSSPSNPQYPVIVGGSGLIGCNLLVLLASTPECKCVRVLDMVPPPAMVLEDGRIPGSKVEFVQHRLGTDEEEALTAALKGADCVFCAVTPHVQLAPKEDFLRTNIDGMRSLVKVCSIIGVSRLVYLSSIAATNHFVESVNQAEDVPLPPWELYHSPYDFSKRTGEELVMTANEEGRLATCALRPGGVLLSPNDFTFRNVLCLPGITTNVLGTKRVDFIDGRDVVRGMLLASQRLRERPAEVGGQAFFLSKGEAIFTTELGTITARCLGWWTIPVPSSLVFLVQICCGAWYYSRRFLKMPVPGVPPQNFISMAFLEQTFDNRKAQELLGFQPKVSIEDAIARICSLYSQQKQLARKEHRDWRKFKGVSVGAAFCFALLLRRSFAL